MQQKSKLIFFLPALILLHEMTQKGTGLTFDVNDIYATVAGVLLGVYLFYFFLLKNKEN